MTMRMIIELIWSFNKVLNLNREDKHNLLFGSCELDSSYPKKINFNCIGIIHLVSNG